MSDPTIRPATTADAPAIQAIYAPIVEQTPISFEEAPPSVDEMAARITDIQTRYPYLVAERAGEILGYAYAGRYKERHAYRWSTEVTAYVAEQARGSGIGRLLYRNLLDRLDAAGFHTAIAIIALPNPASVALHESVGFTHVGTFREVGHKFGRWHDVGHWQRLIRKT